MDLMVIIIGALCFFSGIWALFFYQVYYRNLEKGARPGFSLTLKIAGIGLIVIGLGLIFKSCN